MKNITVSRDKVEQWLEDLEYSNSDKNVIAAIKQTLAAPVQDPLATKTEKGIVLHVGWDDLPAGTKLYTAPPVQPAPVQERNFCERCGKRLGDNIHTCTPPAQPAPVYVKTFHGGKPWPLHPAPVPDAFGTREGEHPQYIQGWNDCRAETLKMSKP